MRKKSMLLLALAPLAAGCILTSGQITINFELEPNPITVTNLVPVIPVDVNLNDIGDYNDHKDKLKDIADVALLGEIVNNGANAIQVEVWVSRDPGDLGALPSADTVRNSPLATLLWGPFELAGAATTRIDWDASADLIHDAGLQVVLDEVRGDTSDGDFVVYVLGPAGGGTFTFSVHDGFIVVTLDAGV
jgi:hypothetical protein